MPTRFNHIEIAIAEKVSHEQPLKFRRREALIDSDSFTVGSDDSADLTLRSFESPFLIEIKFHEGRWWMINPWRDIRVRINRKPAPLDSPLEMEDEINIHGHIIVLKKPASLLRLAPSFTFNPDSDEQLWSYLCDENRFDEILINGLKPIVVDYRGALFTSPWAFRSEDFLVSKIKNLTNQSTGWISWQSDRRLRFQAALAPLVDSPHLTIRKAREQFYTLQELATSGFGTQEQIEFLSRALQEKKNILISGGTSTGKTSLMRSLVSSISAHERLIILEEEAEALWSHPHAVTIEAGRGGLSTAIVESLRMRPDRLIVSEIRSREAADLIQAMNTGHEGSMTTLHANSPREALFRLESLALSGSMTLSALRRQMSQAIHIICQLSRTESGQRFIDQIVEVCGIEGDMILLSEPLIRQGKILSKDSSEKKL